MVGRSSLWLLIFLAACVALAGCGGAERKRQLAQAQEAVVTGLEAWKSGASAESLKSGAAPIEFHDDDWQRSARLVAYEVVLAYHDTDGGPRCATLLTIERPGGKQDQVKVTYQIVTEPKVIIARDPMS